MDCVQIFRRPHLDLGGVGADGEGVAPRLVSPGEGRDDVCLRAVRLRQLQQLLRRACVCERVMVLVVVVCVCVCVCVCCVVYVCYE